MASFAPVLVNQVQCSCAPSLECVPDTLCILREFKPGRLCGQEFVTIFGLDRLPTPGEQQACLKYLEQSPSALVGLQGVLWSLINTREFILQH